MDQPGWWQGGLRAGYEDTRRLQEKRQTTCGVGGAERTWAGWWADWKAEKGLPQGHRADLEEAKVH